MKKGKEKVELSLFAGNMVIYLKSPRELTGKLLPTMRKSAR